MREREKAAEQRCAQLSAEVVSTRETSAFAAESQNQLIAHLEEKVPLRCHENKFVYVHPKLRNELDVCFRQLNASLTAAALASSDAEAANFILQSKLIEIDELESRLKVLPVISNNTKCSTNHSIVLINLFIFSRKLLQSALLRKRRWRPMNRKIVQRCIFRTSMRVL